MAGGDTPDPDVISQVGLLSADAPSQLTGAAGNPVIGQYQLLERIGSGGMGTVFKARHVRLKKTVALKVLRNDAQFDACLTARFSREAEAIGQLCHPNIVQAYDAGEAAGVNFLAMELVSGRDVEKLCRTLGQLPWKVACEIIRQAALGLQHAHERGFLHRDVKPSNLLLSSAGAVKVADLGLAKLVAPETGSLTDAGFVVGTPDYFSPEQARGGEIDARSDLYSLGCTLYRMLAGTVPFPSPEFDTREKKMKAHAERAIQPLSEVRADVPPEVQAIVSRLLAKNPDQRYSSAATLAAELGTLSLDEALGELSQQVPLTEPLPTPRGLGKIFPSTIRPSEGQTATVQPKRQRWIKWYLWLACAATFFGLAALLAGSFFNRQQLPFDDAQNQAEMPLNAWQPVLAGREPLPLVWPQHDPNSTFNFKPAEDRLFLNCTGSGLMSFGRMTRGSYRVQMELLQHDWPGGIGFFWGAKQVGESPGGVWRCQALLVSHSTNFSNGGKHFVSRVVVELPLDSERASHSTLLLARQEIPNPIGGAKTLGLRFAGGQLREVKWDGQQLGDLTKPDIAGLPGSEDHAGQFGVLLETATCTVSDARIQRLK